MMIAIRFWPADRRFGKPNARQSPYYAPAIQSISKVRSNVTQLTERLDEALDSRFTVRFFKAKSHKNSPADVLQLHVKVNSTLLSVGLELLDDVRSLTTNGSTFVFRRKCYSLLDQAKKTVNCEIASAHDNGKEIDNAQLCHDGKD